VLQVIAELKNRVCVDLFVYGHEKDGRQNGPQNAKSNGLIHELLELGGWQSDSYQAKAIAEVYNKIIGFAEIRHSLSSVPVDNGKRRGIDRSLSFEMHNKSLLPKG
jgi:hypothetical protein